MTIEKSTGTWCICGYLMLSMLHPGVQAQNRLASPPRTSPAVEQIILCDFGEARAADQRTGIWSMRTPADGPEGDIFQEASWMLSAPGTKTAIRGVEWMEQNRGAVYNQPGEFTRVRVKWSSSTAIKGMRINQVPMFDDGTHGDKVAGDGIWTLDSLSIYSSTGTPGYRVAKDAKYGSAVSWWLTVEWQLADGTWENDGYAYIRLGLVDPLATFDVQRLGGGLWATEYGLFIEDSLQTQKTFPGYPVTDKSWAYLMKPASNLLYSRLPDAYDFLVVTPATALWLPNPLLSERVPNASSVRNDVQGVGMTLFDNSAGWGSPARLKTVVYYSNGPFNLLAHELGHKWMAYLDSLTFSNGACGVHWAEHQTIGGNMGLWPKVIESPPGVFAGVMQHKPDAFNASYSDLDLYLMGLKPLNEVPLLKRLNNPDYTNPDSVRYTSITTIAPASLPMRYGTRRPAYPEAQRDFTMATVIVKPLGWTDAEFAYFSLLARHAADTLDDGFGYNYNFEKAARKLCTLESKMYTPTGIPSVPVLTSPADGASGQPLLTTLRWDSSQATTSYHVQVSKKNDFTDTLVQKSGVTATSIAPSGLRQGTTYYWRVRASGASGISRFSGPRSFTTGAATPVEASDGTIIREFALHESYPNPFNPSSTISYALPIRSSVTLSVFTALGQQVATLVNGMKEAGMHEVQFNGSGMASGVYFYRMQAADLSGGSKNAFVQTRKFILAK